MEHHPHRNECLEFLDGGVHPPGDANASKSDEPADESKVRDSADRSINSCAEVRLVLSLCADA